MYKVTGSIPTNHYIQLPKTHSQSLGLVGRYMYIQFRVLPEKGLVFHLDLSTTDGLVVRVTFSNLCRVSATWPLRSELRGDLTPFPPTPLRNFTQHQLGFNFLWLI